MALQCFTVVCMLPRSEDIVFTHQFAKLWYRFLLLADTITEVRSRLVYGSLEFVELTFGRNSNSLLLLRSIISPS
jgi:hypothetical protein